MVTSNRFALCRASPDDLPELARLQYKCFPPMIRELFMGCKTEADLPRLVQHHLKSMLQDPSDVWIKVTDQTTGRAVAASNWKVHVNGPVPASADDEAPEWLEGEALEKSMKMLQAFNEARRKANPGGFIRTLLIPIPLARIFYLLFDTVPKTCISVIQTLITADKGRAA